MYRGTDRPKSLSRCPVHVSPAGLVISDVVVSRPAGDAADRGIQAPAFARPARSPSGSWSYEWSADSMSLAGPPRGDSPGQRSSCPVRFDTCFAGSPLDRVGPVDGSGDGLGVGHGLGRELGGLRRGAGGGLGPGSVVGRRVGSGWARRRLGCRLGCGLGRRLRRGLGRRLGVGSAVGSGVGSASARRGSASAPLSVPAWARLSAQPSAPPWARASARPSPPAWARRLGFSCRRVGAGLARLRRRLERRLRRGLGRSARRRGLRRGRSAGSASARRLASGSLGSTEDCRTAVAAAGP